MKNFKIKDLMVTIHAGEKPQLHLMAGGGTCAQTSKCSDTKPNCVASKCSQTKPDCMASKCSQTKPKKHHEDHAAYATQLWTLKQTIAEMQAR